MRGPRPPPALRTAGQAQAVWTRPDRRRLFDRFQIRTADGNELGERRSTMAEPSVTVGGVTYHVTPEYLAQASADA